MDEHTRLKNLFRIATNPKGACYDLNLLCKKSCPLRVECEVTHVDDEQLTKIAKKLVIKELLYAT